MARDIYEVYAKVIDANGSYNTLANYPKIFDSNSYNGDGAKAYKRALGEYHETIGAMCKRDDRKVQIAMLIDGTTGVQIAMDHFGVLNDPEPEGEAE